MEKQRLGVIAGWSVSKSTAEKWSNFPNSPPETNLFVREEKRTIEFVSSMVLCKKLLC